MRNLDCLASFNLFYGLKGKVEHYASNSAQLLSLYFQPFMRLDTCALTRDDLEERLASDSLFLGDDRLVRMTKAKHLEHLVVN